MQIDQNVEVMLQVEEADGDGAAYQAVDQASRDGSVGEGHAGAAC